jgi:Sulfotransferase family
MFDYDHLHTAISGLRNKTIFFVGGTVKSGTTWLRLLLNAHPQVSCGGEAHFARRLAPLLLQAVQTYNRELPSINKAPGKAYPQLSEDDFKYALASCIALALLRQSQGLSALAIGETTPNNVKYFDQLGELFPRAKFIQIIRDGRDAAVSGWFHNSRIDPDWATINRLDVYALKCAENWAADLAATHAFATRNPGRLRQVRYEDLNADSDRTLAGIFGFLGVEASAEIIAQCRADASFDKLSGGRKPGHEDRDSFFRKGIVGDWRNHLSSDIAAQFRERAARWLDQFGYT